MSARRLAKVHPQSALMTRDELVSSSQRQMLSAYKKRADLIPNAAATVEKYASHEKGVLAEVAQARAKATHITLPENATPEQIAAFAQHQSQLSGALGRLLMVSEQYPNLKADAGFLQLQRDLKDIEQQATAARNKYIREIAAFNVNVRTFPNSLVASLFGVKTKPQLEFDDAKAIESSPRVFQK